MATVGQDSFTESLTTALSAHTPDVGAGWTLEAANFQIVAGTNRVRHNTTNALQRARKGDDIGADIMDITALVGVESSSTNRAAGVCARMSTDNFTNQYEAYVQYTNSTTWTVHLFKNVGGTRTEIGNSPQTISKSSGGTATLKLQIRSGTQTVLIDGSTTISATESNATLSGRQYAGLIMNGQGASLTQVDDFLSESVATSTPIAASDTIAVTLTESAAITQITPSTRINATDTLAIVLSESAAASVLSMVVTATDTLAIALSESAAITTIASVTRINATDTLTVVLSERSVRGFSALDTIAVTLSAEVASLIKNTPVASPPTGYAPVWRLLSGDTSRLDNLASRDLEL